MLSFHLLDPLAQILVLPAKQAPLRLRFHFGRARVRPADDAAYLARGFRKLAPVSAISKS